MPFLFQFEIQSLCDVEKLLLYLRLPTGVTSGSKEWVEPHYLVAAPWSLISFEMFNLRIHCLVCVARAVLWSLSSPLQWPGSGHIWRWMKTSVSPREMSMMTTGEELIPVTSLKWLRQCNTTWYEAEWLNCRKSWELVTGDTLHRDARSDEESLSLFAGSTVRNMAIKLCLSQTWVDCSANVFLISSHAGLVRGASPNILSDETVHSPIANTTATMQHEEVSCKHV